MITAIAAVRSQAPLRPHISKTACATILATPLAASALIVLLLTRFNAERLWWSMQNDMIWNTVSARHIWYDGGVQPAAHPTPAPLTNILLALSYNTGRWNQTNTTGLLHSIQQQSILWLALFVLISALFAATAWTRTTKAPIPFRIALTLCAGLLPHTWFISSSAAQLGLMNSSVALLVLTLLWIVWLERERDELTTLTLFVVGSVTMAAAWGLLAAIPVTFGAALAVRMLRSARKRHESPRSATPSRTPARSGWQPSIPWLSLSAATLVAIGYGFAVILPDLQRDADALTADGAIVPLSATSFALIMLLAFTATLAATLLRFERNALTGVILLCGTATLVAAALTLSRISAGQPGWGYYTTKLCWICSGLLLLIMLCETGRWATATRIAGHPAKHLLSAAILLNALGVVGIAAQQLPLQLFPKPLLLTLHSQDAAAARDDIPKELARVFTPGKDRFVVNYTGNPDTDQALNSWLFQLNADRSDAPSRQFSYTFNPEDPQQICSAIASMRQPTIITSNEDLERRLIGECADPTKFNVLVQKPLAAGRQ